MTHKNLNQVNLVETKNNQVLTNSLKVANKFEKEHSKILRDIRSLKEKIGQANFGQSTFYIKETTYTNLQNKTQPAYEFNKDFFTLLVMGFTGEKALKFKIDYINAFNKMEQQLKQNYNNIDTQDNLLPLIPIFTRVNIRYKHIDNIPYFLDSDIFELLELNKPYDLLYKLNIKPKLFNNNNNKMEFGLNFSQIYELLTYNNNERNNLLKSALTIEFKNLLN